MQESEASWALGGGWESGGRMCVVGSGERVVHSPRREELKEKLRILVLLIDVFSRSTRRRLLLLLLLWLIVNCGQILLGALTLCLSSHILL